MSHVVADGLTSEFVPFGIGCLKSFFHAFAKTRDLYEIVLFKDPVKLAEALKNRHADVAGVSNYCWNLNLSYTFADEIKKRFPNTLTIFGGPNYPLDNEMRELWLKERPAIDIYIVGEGEEPFTQLIDSWHENRNLDVIRRSGIPGCHSIVAENLFGADNGVPRLKSLDNFELPYTAGYLDEFLADGLIPLTQTNRGCPYTCTFCEKGSDTWKYITHRSHDSDSFKREIEYIAKRSKGKVLALADNNFGMFPQDIETAKTLALTKEKYDFPHFINTATAKNFNRNVLECLKILGKSLALTASVQSMDDEVLKNIKRTNMPLENYLQLAEMGRSQGNDSRSEVILALPGDTKAKHIHSMCQLMDSGIQHILPYTLMLLDGSELNTSASRSRWKMQTRFRFNHRCFGQYHIFNKDHFIAEIEEVVIGNETLTEEEYYQCRLFGLTTSIFYSDDMIYDLLAFLSNFGIRPSDFISNIDGPGRRFFSDRLHQLYESFNRATRSELWDDRSKLEMFIQEPGNIHADSRDPVGLNILFYHRALALMDLVEDILNAAFSNVMELEQVKDMRDWQEYLDELKHFMCLRRQHFFDYNQVYEHKFNYDFINLAANHFKAVPQRQDTPIKIKFFHTPEQKELMSSFKPGIAGAMRIIPHVGLPGLLRVISYSD